jgi:D-psicose/D-tagatose/L-ribulose 3-epimerase
VYKYGVETLLWAEVFTEDKIGIIGKAKSLGFDGVEIHLGQPGAIPVEKTKRALEDSGMGVHFAVTLTEDTNSISPDRSVREKAVDFFKTCVDTAFAVSGGDCVIGGVNYAAWGYFTGKARTPREWEWAVENYREAARYAGDKGIILAVEPVNRFETYFINTAEDAVQFCRDVGEKNAKVHLDTYHMAREEKNYYRAISDTGDFLGYFHACENERGIPGTGLVHWDEVYGALKDIGYDGWITIESFTPEVEELARLTAIWRKLAPSADALAREGLANIKKIEKRAQGGAA